MFRSAGSWFLSVAVIGGAACSSRSATVTERAPLLGSSGTLPTGRDDLARTVTTMEGRLQRNDGDVVAAVRLADALLRQTRVTGNAGLALRAESVLRRALERDPRSYETRRMLAAVLASEHRFDDAIVEAHRCLAERPNDDWALGVLGDARLERGDYDGAFDAFERMMTLRPNAASYARASYARELSGDLDGAVRLMSMALEATSAHDAEAIAWHRVQLAHLHLERGRVADATRELAHAEFVFPRHPLALEGLARVATQEGRYDEALRQVQSLLDDAPTPALLALAGEISERLERIDDAERFYRLAEAAWTSDAPEPAALALFLADRPGRAVDAVHVAARAAAARDDISTNHALAWAYFKAGRTDAAQDAMTRALRTGSRNRLMRQHAQAIDRAVAELGRR